jgi:methylamine dehydrogenase heavy chain
MRAPSKRPAALRLLLSVRPALTSAGLTIAGLLAAGLVTAAPAANFPQPLPNDPTLTVKTLPEHYPTGWAFLNYAGDRIELRNVGSNERDVKAELQAHDSATLLVSSKRPELYVADTVWARGVRGPRTDFITVYDAKTLKVAGEIDLPGGKRALITAMEGLFAFTDDERMGLVFNFTPASSVSVVDLVNRQLLGSIDIPGCMLVYPSGTRGFSSLCSSGTLLTIRLDEHGAVAGRSESKVFNPLDTDPLFTQSTLIGGVRYFPSLHGRVQPVDLRGDAAQVLPDWPLVGAADEAGGWRPSGWQLLTSDESKLLYIIMQPKAHEGTHKDAGTEVWVFDTATHARVRRLHLTHSGSSIALTHGSPALLLVQSDVLLDVYDPQRGNLLRSMDLPGLRSRLQIETVR